MKRHVGGDDVGKAMFYEWRRASDQSARQGRLIIASYLSLSLFQLRFVTLTMCTIRPRIRTHTRAHVYYGTLSTTRERLRPDDGGHDPFRSSSSTSTTTTSSTGRRRGDANSGRASRLPLCRCRHLASRKLRSHIDKLRSRLSDGWAERDIRALRET